MICRMAFVRIAAGSVAAMAVRAGVQTRQAAGSQVATSLDPHMQTALASLPLLELIHEPMVRPGAPCAE